MATINTAVHKVIVQSQTHTARRSATTHLALQGVNLKIIADLRGWEKVETLRTYL